MKTMLAAWVHDLSPFLIKLDWMGPIGGIRYYGLSYVLGFVLAVVLMRVMLRRGIKPEPIGGKPPISYKDASDIVMTLAIWGVAGGRLGYCLFYDPSLLGFSGDFPFWKALKVWEGGMASHGGFLGALLGGYWMARRRGVCMVYLWDLIAFSAPAGLFLGRCANFINGELWGRKASADFPLAMKFPASLREDPEAIGRLAVHQDACTPEEAAQMVSHMQKLQENGQMDPLLMEYYRIADQMIRLWSQGERSEELRQAFDAALTPRHPSPIYAACLEGLLVGVVVWVLWMKPRRPGLVAGVFCLMYAAVRIIGEIFREPDSALVLGLTKGQALSFLLALGGVMLVIKSIRSRQAPLGGWLPASTSAPEVSPTISNSEES